MPKSPTPSAALFLIAGSLFIGAQVRAANAGAADATTDNDSATSALQLKEIVVTAQKRREDLQQVPISAQVISGRTLSQRNLNSLLDLSQTVPSLHVTFGGQANDMYIRGVGSATNEAFEEAVGTFVDDIYHGRSRMSDATFLDIDRIEVLKGPQTTFFGNNAIAGALNIVTAKPGDSLNGFVRMLYGQFGQYAAEAAVGGPITDTLGIRVAGMREGQSGWIDNVVTGQKSPDENNEVGRVTLAFHPNADLQATLKIEGGHDSETGGFRLQINGCPPPAPFTAAGVCSYALANHLPVGLGNNRNADTPGQLIDLDTFEDVLTVDFHMWNQTFTSVSGFYNYGYNLHASSSGDPQYVATVALPEEYHQYSQEFRVTSDTGHPVEYMAGAYFQTDGLRFTQGVNLPIFNPIITSSPSFAPLVPYLPLGQSIRFAQTEHTYSLFGSLTWNITDRLKATAGIRGSWDAKSYVQDIVAGTATQMYGGVVPAPSTVQPFLGALFGYEGELRGTAPDEHAVMPSAKIQYQLTPSSMVYLSYVRGFLAGGINGTLTTGLASQILFQPEHVNAYEIGIKNALFHDRLLVNVDGFRSDYTDLQVGTSQKNVSGAVVNLIENAASSVSEGIELETQWLLTSELRLGANVTYLESYYTDFKNASALTELQSYCAGEYVLPYCSVYPKPVPATANLTGLPTEYAPLWSGSVSALYSVSVLQNYEFAAELSPYFSSGYFLTTAADEPLTRQGNYVRLDATLTFSRADARWDLDLIGKNLTNADILVYGTSASFPSAPGTTLEAKEEPRNVALQFRYRW